MSELDPLANTAGGRLTFDLSKAISLTLFLIFIFLQSIKKYEKIIDEGIKAFIDTALTVFF